MRSDSPIQTQAIGQAVGSLAEPGDLVLLHGELGAGKTCFTQGVLHGLGSKDHVRSPTFVLIMEHNARLPLYHIDLYRLSVGSDLDSIGIEEYVHGAGLCVVEWADRASSAFPVERLEIRIERVEGDEEGRTLTLTAMGERHAELLRATKQRFEGKAS